MIPRAFEYFAPTTLKEATELLDRYKGEAKVLAGGHSLIPLMKLRLASPPYLVDINRIPGLSYIREEAGEIRIGALTRHYEIETSSLLKEKCPLLPETAAVIGDPQVRSLGTIGGSLAHGDAASDFGSAILALGGRVKAYGPKGERAIKIEDFFVDLFTTALEPNEILTEISFPTPPAGSGGAYLKLERKVGDFATVAVAAQLTLDAKGQCAYAGVGLTSVGPTPLKASKTEGFLKGKTLDEGVIAEASKLAAEESKPTSDLRGSEEYKRDMVRVFTRRALKRALERARGGK